MIKLFLKPINKFLIISVLFLFAININAQMECRSTLGGHLTQLNKTIPLYGAIEGTMAPGIMTSPFDSLDNTQLNGGMLLGALDYTFLKDKHFYIEGGFKNWVNSNFLEDSLLDGRNIGIRQAFLSHSTENLKLKVGLHEMRLGDFFLVDERVFGGSIDKTVNAFTFNARFGTVVNNFARMGKFCANRHLYGIINSDYTENIGKKVGETNLAGFVVNWNPKFKKQKPSTTSKTDNKTSNNEFSDNTDEFSSSSDEFASTDEFSDNGSEFNENHDFNEFGSGDEFNGENKSLNTHKFALSNIALIFYSEFGSSEYLAKPKLYTGALADIILPHEILFQTGAVYQNMDSNNALVYIAKFGKNKVWKNASNTKFGGAFIGKFNIDDNAIFQPLFSNMFLGEVMRLDAANFPLWQASIKHRFPGKLKFHIAVKSVGQITDAKTNEQDFEFGFYTLKKHLKATVIASRIETKVLPNEFYMGRLELRLAF